MMIDFQGVLTKSLTYTWRIIPGLGYVVNNHGDRKSPIPGVIPLPNDLFMVYKWGLRTNYLLSGMIHPPSSFRGTGFLGYSGFG